MPRISKRHQPPSHIGLRDRVFEEAIDLQHKQLQTTRGSASNNCEQSSLTRAVLQFSVRHHNVTSSRRTSSRQTSDSSLCSHDMANLQPSWICVRRGRSFPDDMTSIPEMPRLSMTRGSQLSCNMACVRSNSVCGVCGVCGVRGPRDVGLHFHPAGRL